MHSIITPEILNQTIDFDAYLALTQSITKGESKAEIYQNVSMLRYTLSNLKRMNLVLEQMKLSQKLYNEVSSLSDDLVWLLITEPWCGDASWGNTAIHVIASASDKIELRILLRDSFPEVIKYYHTEGSESIPKLICLHKSTMTELWTWGPRPAALQKQIDEFKEQSTFDFRESVRKVHDWYEHDKTLSIQDEILQLLKTKKYSHGS